MPFIFEFVIAPHFANKHYDPIPVTFEKILSVFNSNINNEATNSEKIEFILKKLLEIYILATKEEGNMIDMIYLLKYQNFEQPFDIMPFCNKKTLKKIIREDYFFSAIKCLNDFFNPKNFDKFNYEHIGYVHPRRRSLKTNHHQFNLTNEHVCSSAIKMQTLKTTSDEDDNSFSTNSQGLSY
ncbi:hypothetical protein [Alphaproteobacteria bacterium endosymbiont of Tiliacea citrago]|uniref:hypothetical protein n=1 Tax=Alphaproteobacteria bacterium endosymbiont of Tiliacea citrago TaxID=3077944 RepID=UPI00313A8F19